MTIKNFKIEVLTKETALLSYESDGTPMKHEVEMVVEAEDGVVVDCMFSVDELGEDARSALVECLANDFCLLGEKWYD